ncbi:hypothetical protein NHX12_023821 [Muraenolepis orangiensis]|uniref:Uncharacterized protein n=1 Tax=Muraenolepis orangiensis TaxID=630683 RepID=A0A9Q0IT59_9TELE|nr:hypothetical protein NHX12_023821 [Muraenolepis orangiensis]
MATGRRWLRAADGYGPPMATGRRRLLYHQNLSSSRAGKKKKSCLMAYGLEPEWDGFLISSPSPAERDGPDSRSYSRPLP